MDDVAGQYSDYQDRQEKSNRTTEEVIEDTIIAWLDVLFDEEFGVWTTRPAMKERVQGFIEHLKDNGFEITIRKEVSP